VIPDSTYAIQLFFHNNISKEAYIAVHTYKGDTTKAANPKHLLSAYKFGNIPSKQSKSVNNIIACNAMLAKNQCGSAVTLNDITDSTGNLAQPTETYNTNSWFTFLVQEPGSVNITTTYNTDINTFSNLPPKSNWRIFKETFL